MFRQAAVLSFLLLPQPGYSDVLTFGIWPSSNPASGVSCRIELKSGQINVVEVRGTGMPPKRPLRWPVRRGEEVAVLASLAALISGDLTSVDIYQSRSPPAPYVTVTWSTTVDEMQVSGLYIQSGLALPATLSQLIDTVMPGSGCQTATN